MGLILVVSKSKTICLVVFSLGWRIVQGAIGSLNNVFVEHVEKHIFIFLKFYRRLLSGNEFTQLLCCFAVLYIASLKTAFVAYCD